MMKLISFGKISLRSFLLASSIFLVPFIGVFSQTLQYFVEEYLRYVLLLHIIAVNVWLKFVYQDRDYQVAVRGGFLGHVFGIGSFISFSEVSWSLFGMYMAILAFFHWSEYMITAICNPRTLSLESYLLDHSREYHIAAVASWTEFWIEWYFFPGLKHFGFTSIMGLLLAIGGEVLRKLAMWTAKTNFNHYVQHVKEEGHELVTSGIYAYSRHPSYVGWFYWSVGTQMVLCNPVCLIGYTYVSWKFFKHRIYDEEITLLNFFGEHYVDYQKRVGTGLPFIKGYRLEK